MKVPVDAVGQLVRAPVLGMRANRGIGSGIKQDADDLGIAGRAERRIVGAPVIVQAIRIGSRFEQDADAPDIPFRGGPPEGGMPFAFPVDTGSETDQFLEDAVMPESRGDMRDGFSAPSAYGVGIITVREHDFGYIGAVVKKRPKNQRIALAIIGAAILARAMRPEDKKAVPCVRLFRLAEQTRVAFVHLNSVERRLKPIRVVPFKYFPKFSLVA